MEENGMNPKKIVNRMGLALFIMATVILGVQVIIQVFLNTYAPEIFDTDWYAMVVTAITVAGIGLPVFYFASKWVPKPEKKAVVKLRVSQFVVLFFISVAAMYLASYFGYFINFIITLIKGGEIINPLQDVILGSNIIITILYGAILGPIVEELIFRKLLLDRLRPLGDLPAILLSGLAFGLFHMNISQFFYAAVLGFIFAYVTIKTNTVKYSILLHIMINSIGTVLAPLVLKDQSMILAMVMGLWIICSITIGSVFFFLNVKKIRFEKGEMPAEKKSIYILNAGTILFILISLYMIVIQLLQ